MNTRNHDIAARTKERTYVLPHPALRAVISHYTVFQPRKRTAWLSADAQLQILPDASGCIVCAMDSGGIDLHFWGATSKAVSVDNGVDVPPMIVFVEFLPGGAGRLLRMPMQPWQDQVAPLECVDSELHRRIVEAFSASCGNTLQKESSAFLHALNQIFLVRLEKDRDAPLAEYLLSSIQAARGMERMDVLTRATGYSRRHLNRVAADCIGMNIKLFSRIIRMNHVCHALSAPKCSLTALAHSFDYHDQAHFIHDFKSICGVTPGQYREAMSHFYNEELKLIGSIPGV